MLYQCSAFLCGIKSNSHSFIVFVFLSRQQIKSSQLPPVEILINCFFLNRCCQYNKQQLVVIMVYYIHIRIAKKYPKRRITIYLALTFPNACFGWQLILKIKAICKLCFYVKSFVLVSNKILLTEYIHTQTYYIHLIKKFSEGFLFFPEKKKITNF